jgi:hypothetical protein
LEKVRGLVDGEDDVGALLALADETLEATKWGRGNECAG